MKRYFPVISKKPLGEASIKGKKLKFGQDTTPEKPAAATAKQSMPPMPPSNTAPSDKAFLKEVTVRFSPKSSSSDSTRLVQCIVLRYSNGVETAVGMMRGSVPAVLAKPFILSRDEHIVGVNQHDEDPYCEGITGLSFYMDDPAEFCRVVNISWNHSDIDYGSSPYSASFQAPRDKVMRSFSWSKKENKIASVKWQPRPSPKDELDDGHFFGYENYTPTYNHAERDYDEPTGSPTRYRTIPKGVRPDASYLYLVPPTAREQLKTLQKMIHKEGFKTRQDNTVKYGHEYLQEKIDNGEAGSDANIDAQSKLKVFLSRHKNIQRRLQICCSGSPYCGGNIFDPALVPEWKRCSQDGCSDQKQPCLDCARAEACRRCRDVFCREHLGSHETDCLRSLSRKCGFKKDSDTLEIQCCGRVETSDARKQCRKCSTLCCEDCFFECLGPPSSNGKRSCGKGWCSSCSSENIEEEERCCYDCLELASDSEKSEEDSDYGDGGDD